MFEDDDEEVFKILKDGYSSSEASSSDSEGILSSASIYRWPAGSITT